MALSKEWYDAEFVDSESETLHRLLNIVSLYHPFIDNLYSTLH